jgi:hypothetical protein
MPSGTNGLKSAASVFRLGVDGDGFEIHASDLAMILDGIDLASVTRQRRYRRPQPTTTC